MTRHRGQSALFALTTVALVFQLLVSSTHGLQEHECSVCFKILNNLVKQVAEGGNTSDEAYTSKFLENCANLKPDGPKHEKSFCYYLGGAKNSATRTYGEMTKKLSQGLPVDKVCEYLNSRDSQVCQLREKQQIKLKDLDLNSMKASQLRKILNDKGDPCKGCVEKSEFLARLNKIKQQEEENSAEL